ncbi:cache domain-containing protein [Methanospirillum hungatei]|uniref:cache domain-containing protein n=1 Tax=Methanospirillum hungatei TaxID=2203 RepID=UPI0026EF4DFE|nr:cache domain-containing protein [Methanospirillum hungatei]MCA1915874.1 cache domain-containing protein [Methanospirillum hungatei]
MIRSTASVGVYFIALSFFCAAGCIAQETGSEITSYGTITYIDLEGGFYGFIAQDGAQYLPLDLPDEYKQDGLHVDITGVIDPDVVTIQMWGQPLRILSITKHKGFTQSDSWYEGDTSFLSPEEELAITTLEIRASAALSKALQDCDAAIAAYAAELKGKNLKSPDAQGYLEKVAKSNPAIFEVSLLDRSGTIIAVYPEKYSSSIGSNVRNQTMVTSVIRNPAPGMSEYFKTVEGEYAVSIMYPIYSSSLSVTGYLSVLIHPALLVENSLDSLTDGSDLNILVIQPDGTIIGYEGSLPAMVSDPSAIQKMAFIASSPVGTYPAGFDMLSLGDMVASGEYTTLVYWNTVSLHNTPWRVMVF